MPQECFDELFYYIAYDIAKENTNFREAITSEERLAIT